MVAGILLARYAAESANWVVALAGLAQTLIGALVLAWSGQHYVDLHGPIAKGTPVVHPVATRTVGLTTVVFAGFALAFSIVEISIL